jgi:hypothetical protein
MASSKTPLNKFSTIARVVTNNTDFANPATIVSTTPTGTTRIVLGAQVSNLTTNPITITFKLVKNSDTFVLLNAFTVPPHDAVDVTTGKLVLEEGVILKMNASAANAANLVLSVLDTSNE